MNERLLNFEITESTQKSLFSDVIDWERNYRKLRCESHSREPKLRLRTGKGGNTVSVDACCGNFFANIVERKSNRGLSK